MKSVNEIYEGLYCSLTPNQYYGLEGGRRWIIKKTLLNLWCVPAF